MIVDVAEVSGCRFRIRQRRDPAAVAAANDVDIPPTFFRDESWWQHLSATITGSDTGEYADKDFEDCRAPGQQTFYADAEAWEAAELRTLEALAAGVRVIARPVLCDAVTESAVDDFAHHLNTSGNASSNTSAGMASHTTMSNTGMRLRARPDLLVRMDTDPHPANAAYMPVVLNNHRVVRSTPKNARTEETAATSSRSTNAGHTASAGATTQSTTFAAIPLHRLGRSGPTQWQGKAKHYGPHAAVASHDILARYGLADGRVGVGGLESPLVAVFPVEQCRAGWEATLQVPIPTEPSRLKECGHCRFEPVCMDVLRQRDDISLVLPGDKARPYRERGITTVSQLARSGKTDAAAMAVAYQQNWPVIRRPQAGTSSAAGKSRQVDVPRAERELDIDMEASLSRCYLWGTWDGQQYRPFSFWDDTAESEAENFAAFWHWLQDWFAQAQAAGESARAYCYGRQGENRWLLRCSERYSGLRTPAGIVPTPDEVQAFISSPQWVDVAVYVKQALLGPDGAGLKVVAPLAGYHWHDPMDGEISLRVYQVAIGADDPDTVGVQELLPAAAAAESRPTREQATSARDLLQRYNGDDCRATAKVRQWLSAGAPGVPHMPAL